MVLRTSLSMYNVLYSSDKVKRSKTRVYNVRYLLLEIIKQGICKEETRHQLALSPSKNQLARDDDGAELTRVRHPPLHHRVLSSFSAISSSRRINRIAFRSGLPRGHRTRFLNQSSRNNTAGFTRFLRNRIFWEVIHLM